MRFEDTNTFKREIIVRGFECDMNNRMKLSAILREMQEIGNIHLESLGYPKAVMLEREQAFLLSRIYIKIYRNPREGEKLIQQTAPKKTKGIYFFRDISFYTTDGELLIEAHTAWVLVSTADDKHSVLRPKMFTLPFECDSDTDYTISSWKAALDDESLENAGERIIRYTDIDGNRHMNNAVYADIACDFMPIDTAVGRETDEFRILFKNEAFLGEAVSIKRCLFNEDGEEHFGIRGFKENGEVCFESVIKFK